MNADRLLAHYKTIADAPDAIARLRRFILDLAVRGKLVPQDANDEPASDLLKRIAKEKARLVKEGGFNSLEYSVEPSKSEPFAIPPSWTWCLLDDIAGIARGGSPRPIKSFLTEDPKGIPWIKIGDSTRGTIYIDATEERIKPEGLSRSRLVVPGDLLLSNSMSFGYPYITNISGCIHDGWLVIRTPESQISKLYIHSLFLSEYAKQAFSLAAAGAVVQNLNADKVRRLQVPLPPLAEQHRIVAKVDELMGLCDRLEAARAGREAVRDRLAAASLARLNAPDPETFEADARFALDALPALTTRSDQIKALRQTILNLAVRGKLVPQDASDEPASELLAAISGRRRILVAEGMVRSTKELARKPSGELFAVPPGWVWTTANHMWDFENGDRSKNYPSKDQLVEKGVPFINAGHLESGLVSLENMNFITTAKFNQLGGGKLRRGDQLYCLRGSLGKHAIFLHNGDAAIASSLVILRPIEPQTVPYLTKYLGSDIAQAMLKRFDNGTAQPNLSSANLRRYEIPLPPLAEQRRIVAKVDALMALCDRLEASLAATAATRRRLLDALLAEVLAPAEDRELEAAE